jgi:hypothetical protein
MQGINNMFFLLLGKGYYLNFSFDKEAFLASPFEKGAFLAPPLEKEAGGI